MSDGDYFRHLLRKSPWMEFVLVSFAGTAYDGHLPIEKKIAPENLAQTLRDASMLNNLRKGIYISNGKKYIVK